MLASTLLLISLLGGSPGGGCTDRCSAGMNRCSLPCGQNQKCMDKCSNQSQRCMESCAAEDRKSDKAEKKNKLPCGVNEDTKTMIPCSEKEEREGKEALKALKDVCKDKEGLPIACPGDKQKIKEKLKKYGVEIDCTDSSGMPIECPGNPK
jgi:hypothetical protein